MEAATVRMTLASRLRVLGDAYLSREQAPDPRASAEFARLFDNPAGAVCPPCQSAFLAATSPHSRKLANLENHALNLYRRFGFGHVAGSRPADHIGVLLTFAGHIIEADPSSSMLRAYSKDHLEWIPPFCEQLAAKARHSFYRELAESTRHAVASFCAAI